MAALAGTRVGTGYVQIEPELGARFQEAIGRKLNEQLTPAFKKVGKRASKEIGREAERDLRSSLAPLARRFEKFGAEASNAITKGFRKRAARSNVKTVADSLGLDDMSAFFDKAKKDAQQSLPVVERLLGRLRSKLRPIRADFAGLGGEIRRLAGKHLRGLGGELRRVASEFSRADNRARVTSSGFGGFDGVMARVNRSAQFFRNVLRTIKWPVLIAGLGLSLQGLSALAAGAIAAATALGSLSGVVIALPAALLAGAQAMGAFKLATAGVGDAVKAALDAEVSGGGQAVDVMRQQQDAAERVADAKRNLTDVQKQARSAQDDLREARESATRQLQDMRLAAEGAGTGEKQAALSLREARQQLARTLRDPEASGLDVQGAELAVQQARNDLEGTRVEARRAREDYRDARKGGIEQMPEVVAAKEAEADAERAVIDAQRELRRATEDMTTAMEGQGAAASALQEKMSQLPPAAQKFVRFLVAMKPRLDVLRDAAAEGFFPGAEDGLKGALKNFGVVRRIVDGTSSALGRLSKKAGRKLGSEIWGRDLERLGKLNTRIIDRFGGSLLNTGDAFRHVLVSAEPFLDWLSEGTEEFSEWLKTEAAAGRESGRLSAFFDRTRETMERVWPILKGVGGALLNISDAADSFGNEILVSLGDAAEGWRKWTDSTKGQNRLKTYFAETKPAVFELGRLVRDAGKAFLELGRQQGVAHLLRLVRTELIPAMRDLVGATTGWASGFLKDFGRLRDQGVPAFDAFVRTLAEHAGEAGLKIAKALADGFVNASIWGKLVIGGFILTKFGGKGALLAAGAAMGKWLGLGIASGAGSAAAGGIAGGLMSRLKAIKWGRIGGLGLGLTLADSVMHEFDRRTGENSGDLLTELSKKGDPSFIARTAALASPFGTEHWADEEQMAENITAQVEEMRKKRVQLSGETIRSLRVQAQELGLTKQARAQLERMFEIARAGRRLKVGVDLGMDPAKLRKITQDFGFLRRGIGASAKDISRVSQRAGRVIVQTFGRGTKEARELTARNMRLTAGSYALEMERSGDFTKEGMARIRRLIRTADLLSPTRKQAEAFGRQWARSMDETHKVTGRGINRIIREAEHMKGPMKRLALETWLDQAKQAQKSGKLSLEAFRRLRSRMFSEFGTFKASGKAFNREFAQGVIDMVNESGGALGILMKNVSSALTVLGGKGGFDFTVQKAGAAGGSKAQKKQGGGFIVPGSGSGDTFRTMLPPGSFILNREATRESGFQNGGLMPVALEPKERVFMPPEVRELGARNLKRLNEKVPRFQRGGQLGGEPRLAGPAGSLRDLGQSAIAKVYDGARDYLAKHQPKFRGFFAGGKGSVVERMGRILFGAGLDLESAAGIAGNSYQESGWSTTAMEPGTDNGGLFGFTAGEKSMAALRAYAARIRHPWDDVDTQVNFMLTTLGGSMRSRLNALSSIADTTALFMEGWERPDAAYANLPRRIEGAMKALPILKRLQGGANGMREGGLLKLARGGPVGQPRDGNPFNWSAMRGGAASGPVERAGSVEGYLPKTIGRIKNKAKDIAAAFSGYVWGGGHGEGTNVRANGLDCSGAIAKLVQLSGWKDFVVAHSSEYARRFMQGRGDLFTLWSNNSHTFAEIEDRMWGTNTSNGLGYHSHSTAGFTPTHPMLAPEVAPAGTERSSALKGRPSLPGQVSGEFIRHSVVKNGDKPDELRAIQRRYKVQTAPLSFGGDPTTLEAVRKEMAKRRLQLDEYNAAAGDVKRKDVKEALLANARLLRKRIRRLREVRAKLLIKEKLGFKPAREAAIDQQGTEFERLRENAEQVMSLEPEDGPAAAAWVRDRETPAWQAAFAQLGSWRNAIIGGQEFAVGRLAGIAQRIQAIRELKKTNPTFFKRYKGRIPALEAAANQVREVFNPGPPRSGRLEESLGEVQGPFSLERGKMALPPDPEPGRFGGIVWDTQMQLRELGIKLKQASESASGEDDSERTGLLEELLRQSNLRNLVGESMFKVFRDFEKTYPVRDLPPFGGKFHGGGTAPGPANQEVIALLRGQERIRTPEQEIAMAKEIRGLGGESGGVTLAIDKLIVNSDGSVTAVMPDGQEVRTIAREVVREETREGSGLRLR